MIEMPENLVEMALKTMGDRWKVMIIQELIDGTKRFGEIKKELGDITQKVLTSNLRALEEKGILIRTVYAQIPPKVEYTLTNLGYNLKPVLDSMRAWAEEYYNQNGELRSSTKLVNIYPLEELPNLDVLPKKQAAEVNSGNKDNYWGNAFGSAAPASDIPF